MRRGGESIRSPQVYQAEGLPLFRDGEIGLSADESACAAVRPRAEERGEAGLCVRRDRYVGLIGSIIGAGNIKRKRPD